MPLTKFGIYLAYAPTVDLRREGLGRYLAAFLKGAAQNDGVQFVIVCPSWSRESLESLFDEESVPRSSFKIVSPIGQPALLRLYTMLVALRKRREGPSRLKRFWSRVSRWKDAGIDLMLQKIASTKSMISLMAFLLPVVMLAMLVVVLTPLWLFAAICVLFGFLSYRLYRRYGSRLVHAHQRLRRMVGRPKDDGLVLRMYRSMEVYEGQRIQELIEAMNDVCAWYSPTAFWPAFNRIAKPRLMCVPDVVLADFPVGFSDVGGDRFLQNFQQVEKSIQGGSHFVTYSEYVKWGTLVNRYGVDPENVTVVHHAPNDLSRWITVKGLDNAEAASKRYCGSLLVSAIRRTANRAYTTGFENRDLKFLFYASQLRPNKNVLTLLRAYEHLLRRRLIGHKLILTGDPSVLTSVKSFIKDHRLEKEVLFLHGLKIQELAACYKLADLAVNPSLSEGGCPFTFTEALSVNTPVVMSRIAVSEEVLSDPTLQQATFFDPYDWTDLAARIEWALSNRDELLELQLKAYRKLAIRGWHDVVSEHIVALHRISNACPTQPLTQ